MQSASSGSTFKCLKRLFSYPHITTFLKVSNLNFVLKVFIHFILISLLQKKVIWQQNWQFCTTTACRKHIHGYIVQLLLPSPISLCSSAVKAARISYFWQHGAIKSDAWRRNTTKSFLYKLNISGPYKGLPEYYHCTVKPLYYQPWHACKALYYFWQNGSNWCS